MSKWILFNKNKKFRVKSELTYSVLALSFLVLTFQQCSKAQLERQILNIHGIGDAAMGIPKSELMIRRYVVMLDMSHSMISGACPQDSDGLLKSPGSVVNTSATASYSAHYNDPNIDDSLLTSQNRWDHRFSGANCKVDQNLANGYNFILNYNPTSIDVVQAGLTGFPQILIPTFYQTHLGNDFEGDRFKIVKTWLQLLRDTSTQDILSETKFMLVPVTAGEYQSKLTAKIKNELNVDTFQFISLTDKSADGALLIDKYLNWLEEEQKNNLDLIDVNSSIVDADDSWFYEKSTMGATALGSLLDPLYKHLTEDMRSLTDDGILPFAQYDVISISDGMITPSEGLISKIQSNCVSCDSNIRARSIDSWGDPSLNTINYMDSMFARIEQLTLYFGAGLLKTHFVQLHPDRVAQNADPGQKPFYNDLKARFESRNAEFNYSMAENGNPPFILTGLTSKSLNFKVTNLFILNPNYRVQEDGSIKVDSDGDGLPDDRESQFGMDPLKNRSDSICLDSIESNPAYTERCVSMRGGQSCNNLLDTDGDGLNECEEMVLNTNPFDFDSDHDGIPDSLEFLYGFNPLVNDSDKDQNSDGMLNIVQFSKGLGPAVPSGQIDSQKLISYESNYIGPVEVKTQNGLVSEWIDGYQIILHRLPIARAQKANELSPLYLGRLYNGISENIKNLLTIDGKNQVLAPAYQPYTNNLIAIARLVNKNDPTQIRWKLFKANIPVASENINVPISWSQFEDIKTMNTGAL